MVALPYIRETVEITPGLARSGGVSIPIGAIASVHVSVSYHLLTTLAVLLTVGAVAGGFGSGNGLVLLGLAAAAALCFWIGARRKTFCVVVATSGGTTSTFAQTRQSEFANEIKSALETAISERG